MPGPRLQEKRQIAASLASERKQEIDKGKKLVDAIGALRETKEKEQSDLEEWRVNTIALIQSQIDHKTRENAELEQQNIRLKEERFAAQAPLDLQEEWARANEATRANEEWNERLGLQQIELLAREEDARVFAEKLESESKQVEEEHAVSGEYLRQADEKLAQADEALLRAERQAQTILQEAQERENHVRIREEDATEREIVLSKREEEVEAHEINLSNREQKLKTNQDVFIRAQNYIKSKKK